MCRLLFVLIIMVGCKQKNNLPAKPIVNEIAKQTDSIKSLVKEGDIIFRGGTDIESSIIKEFSQMDKTFSHCGVVVKENNLFTVVHILGGQDNFSGSILHQTIDSFINYPQNESIGVYATSLPVKNIAKLKYYIDSVERKKITFDINFNLKTKDKLYCTEMLIDALKFATESKYNFSQTKYALKNTKWQLLCNDGDNFLYYPIDVFQHNKSLNKKAIFYFPNYKN